MHSTTALPLALLEREFPQTVVALPNGTQVAVRQRGEPGAGPSVVLLHGISSGAASWLHVALALGSCHVVAWDAPGYGESTPLASPTPTAQDYAARLHLLFQSLRIKRCVVVGHSLGALMGAAYARGPGADSVARLVLISPAGGYGAAELAETRAKVRAQRLEALQTLGVPGIAQRIDQRLLSPAADNAAREWIRRNAARLQPAGYLQAVELLCQSDLGAGAPLAMPVEVHCGDADVVTTPDASAAWAWKLSAPFHLIADAGHASPTEQPAAVARLIARAVPY
ncbi:MAG: alpha/beta hydrolase fold protein [Rhodoferax sp.]|nr:alpha/beta hydrolase fold protein [Rhodoferax sp.]